MFNMESWSTITESAVELADSNPESADSTTDSAANPLKIGLWVWALRQQKATVITVQNVYTYHGLHRFYRCKWPKGLLRRFIVEI